MTLALILPEEEKANITKSRGSIVYFPTNSPTLSQSNPPSSLPSTTKTTTNKLTLDYKIDPTGIPSHHSSLNPILVQETIEPTNFPSKQKLRYYDEVASIVSLVSQENKFSHNSIVMNASIINQFNKRP